MFTIHYAPFAIAAKSEHDSKGLTYSVLADNKMHVHGVYAY